MTTKEIRRQFLNFFQSKGHKIIDSAPIVVKDDPTLMFTNAGMNPFKDYFLGNKIAQNTKVANTQKCLRVSGKHNDLEEVGVDTYHHTMFEMLGNWSFGDYFKKEAIAWAWELLTESYKLDKDRLYITFFEGDNQDGIQADTEAADIWSTYIDKERILPFNKKDNFWEMGDTGPCGPCSEIHIDLRSDTERSKINGATLVNRDHPQVIEIWNLVFIQFNRKKDGSLVDLPQKHVDTGMGLERLVRSIQAKRSNYDIDVFQDSISFLAQLSGFQYGESSHVDIAFRVIVDHIRAIAFSIADGQLLSNTGAGYVIRRILRRALRYGYTYLNLKDPFLYKLIPVLSDQFDVFPELKNQQEFIVKVIHEEEKTFLRTLSRGLGILKKHLQEKKNIDGHIVFELYDTYGFPPDLTELIAKEAGKSIDINGFEKCLEEQKNRSRIDAKLEQDDWVIVREDKTQEFVGYDYTKTEVHITRYRKIVKKKNTFFQLVFQLTPFYGQSGGQVGDTGYIQNTNQKIAILDTQKENNLIVHIVAELPEDIRSMFYATVDAEKRKKISKNHSATHLLHAALKQVLGDHVQQRGSLVDERYLRFDFSHFSKMTQDEMDRVGRLVNLKIQENIHIKEDRAIPIEQALKNGATALFGEKYDDVVRMITFDELFSKELCGGTHVEATGQIGLFKIVSEGSIAAGIRRIEAYTGYDALSYLNEKEADIRYIAERIKNHKNVLEGVENILEENKQLKKQIQELQDMQVKQVLTNLKPKIQVHQDMHFIVKSVSVPAVSHLKELAFELKKNISNIFILLVTEIQDKAYMVILISEDLAHKKQWHAGELVKQWSKYIGGGGGGQMQFATAGGKNIGGVSSLLEAANTFIVS